MSRTRPFVRQGVVGLALRSAVKPGHLESVSMKIYVGNLPYSTTEDDLKNLFAPYGKVAGINVITDKFSGESKGFAFVEMQDNSEADQAIKALNESPLKGRKIKVNQAKPQEERPRPRY